MFRLWYMTFMGESRGENVHAHECPWSMRRPAGDSCVALDLRRLDRQWNVSALSLLLQLARELSKRISGVLLIPHSRFTVPLEIILSIVAVLVALEGWLIADKFYRRKPERPAQYAAALPAGYKLLANKYYVDEFYSAVIVKPLLGISKYVLEWVVDIGILGGAGLAARRHRHIRGSDPAALAIGQSALLCGVAGRGRGGGAALPAGSVGNGAGQSSCNSPWR